MGRRVIQIPDDSWLKSESAFRDMLKEIPCYTWKPNDLRSFWRTSGVKHNGRQNCPPAIADRIVGYRNHLFAFEIKDCSGNLYSLDDHAFLQLGRLLSLVESNGGYAFFVFFVSSGVYLVYVKVMKQYLKQYDRKSIPVKHIEALGHQIMHPDGLRVLMDKFIVE